MATTNVPLPTFTDAGLVVPTEPDILAGVFEDWVAAFALSGKSLNTELTTPQGQIAQTQAYLLQQLNARMLQLIANVDPNTSSGAFQDALGQIYRLTRQPATYATVTAVVSGIVGQTLPAGAQARAADGSLWASRAPVTFGSNGTATAVFRALEPGAGPSVGVNGLTIYQRRPGWEGIANAAPSAPGRDVESRQAFEDRRLASVSIGGNGTADSVRAAVANVVGVSDLFLYNNGSSSAINYGTTDYPIPAHSIAISVAGGDPASIAAAIHSKLDCGCGMASSPGQGTLVTQEIEDRVNYTAPYPRYFVRFVRPATVPVYVRVVVADLGTLPSTYIADVQAAVASAITSGFRTSDGSINVSRGRIGGQLVAADYYAALLTLPNITPLSLTIGFAPDPSSGTAITMGIDQLPVCVPTNVTVVTGDV